MTGQRFNPDASTFEEAQEYFINRSIQLLPDNVCLKDVVPLGDWGVKATLEMNSPKYVCQPEYQNLEYQSIYVLRDHRKQGLLSNYIETTDIPFITSPDCHIESYFRSKGTIV